MSKFSKIVIFLLIILLSICTFSLATDINMNITEQSNTSNGSNVSTYSNNINSNNYNNIVSYNMNSNDSNSSNRVTDSSNSNINSNTQIGIEASQTQVSSISKTDANDGLGLSNVLNILLIVVGVVLILLSIAILIRLNS